MARYIYDLCQYMTVSEVSRHPGLDWKTVKGIDKHYLEQDFGQPDLDGLNILAVDEISIRKGHRCLTVVLDYGSSRVVYVGKDRKAKTLKHFLDQLNDQQRDGIKAVKKRASGQDRIRSVPRGRQFQPGYRQGSQ